MSERKSSYRIVNSAINKSLTIKRKYEVKSISRNQKEKYFKIWNLNNELMSVIKKKWKTDYFQTSSINMAFCNWN